MTLYLRRPVAQQLFVEADVATLLQQTLSDVRSKQQQEPVGGLYWYPDRPSRQSARATRFGVVSSIYLNKLTWGDVSHIIMALQSFYLDEKNHFAVEYWVDDSERGSIGSGVIQVQSAPNSPSQATER